MSETIDTILKMANRQYTKSGYYVNKAYLRLMMDYYNGEQVANWDDAVEVYRHRKEGYSIETADDLTIRTYGKIGPTKAELDNTYNGMHLYMARWPETYPVTKKIIDTLGCVYDNSPKRTLIFKNENERKNAIIDELLKEMPLDSLLMKIDRMSLLQGVAGVLIEYIQDVDPEGNLVINENNTYTQGSLRLTPLYAHNIDVKTDDNKHIIAVKIEYMNLDGIDNKEHRFVRTITNHKDILQKNNEQPVEKTNPLGIIPIVWLHKDLYPEHFWSPGYGDIIVGVNRAVNEEMNHERNLIRYQTQTTHIISGINRTKQPTLSVNPEQINIVEDDGSGTGIQLLNLSPNGSASIITNSVRERLQYLCIMLDLPYDIFTLSISTSDSSLAQMGAGESMRKAYERRQRVIKPFERRLFSMIVKVLSVYATKLFENDEPDVLVEFPRWDQPGMTQIIEQLRFALVEVPRVIGTPLMTPAEAIAKLKNLPKEEAEQNTEVVLKYWKDNKLPQAGAEQGQALASKGEI